MFRVPCCLAGALAAHAATPLFEATFEKPSQGWAVLQGTATPDSTVLHGANKSLSLEPAQSGGGPVVRFAAIPTIGRRCELIGCRQ